MAQFYLLYSSTIISASIDIVLRAFVPLQHKRRSCRAFQIGTLKLLNLICIFRNINSLHNITKHNILQIVRGVLWLRFRAEEALHTFRYILFVKCLCAVNTFTFYTMISFSVAE